MGLKSGTTSEEGAEKKGIDPGDAMDAKNVNKIA
jgi:hypothetical protein